MNLPIKENMDKRFLAHCQLSNAVLAVNKKLLPTANCQLVIGSDSGLLPTANCQPPKGGNYSWQCGDRWQGGETLPPCTTTSQPALARGKEMYK